MPLPNLHPLGQIYKGSKRNTELEKVKWRTVSQYTAVALLSTAFTSLQADKVASKYGGMHRGTKNVASFSEAELRRRSLHLTTFHFTSRFNCFGRDYTQEIQGLVRNQNFRTECIIGSQRWLYKVRWMQFTHLLPIANFNPPPVYAQSLPFKIDNQNAAKPLASPMRATRPAQLIHNLFTTKVSYTLETIQYYNSVLYIYVFIWETKKNSTMLLITLLQHAPSNDQPTNQINETSHR
jgi:hypothetical protein